MTEFKSPLAVTSASPYGAVAFGVPAMAPEILALRTDLQARLHRALAHLPPVMRQEGVGMIEAYSGEATEFYRLFYQPVWSFLHWVAARATPSIPPSAMDDACTAQALGLFLHLWDDHLCDGQLQTTQLSLQVRTDAWVAYLAAARRLAQHVGAPQRLVDDHVATYLTAIHIPERIDSLVDFCGRFERQIAIWTLVPHLLGPAIGGTQVGDDLAHMLTAFANAWRVMDDIQDVDDDVLAGIESAVWQVLDAAGRQAWAACHVQSKPLGQLHAASWLALQEHINDSGCMTELLASTDGWLETAAALAKKNRWPELAEEILAHRPANLMEPGP